MPDYRAAKFLFGPDERYIALTDTLPGMQRVFAMRGGKSYLVTDEENLTKLQTREHVSGGVSCAEYLKANGIKIITVNTLIDQTFRVGSAEWKGAKKAYNTLRDHPEKFPAAMQSDLAKTIFAQGPIGQESGSINVGADLDVVFNPLFAKLPEPQAILSEGYAMAGSQHVVFQEVPRLSQEDQKKLKSDPELGAMWARYKKFIKSGKADFTMRAGSMDDERDREIDARESGMHVPRRNLEGRPTGSSEYLVTLSGSLPLGESIHNFNKFLADRLSRDSKNPGEMVSAGIRLLFLNFHKKQPSLGAFGTTDEHNPQSVLNKMSIKPEVMGIEGRFNTQTWQGNPGDQGGFLFSKTIKTLDELEQHATEVLKGFKEYLNYEGAPENRTFHMIMHHSGMGAAEMLSVAKHDAPEERTKSFAEQAAIMAAAGLTGISGSLASAALGGADRPQLGSGAEAADDGGSSSLTIAAAAAGAAVLAGGAYLAHRYLGGGGAEPPPVPQPRGASATSAARGRGKRR